MNALQQQELEEVEIKELYKITDIENKFRSVYSNRTNKTVLININQLIKKYLKGATLNQLSFDAGVGSTHTISKILNENGIEVKRRTKKPINIDDIESLYNQNYSLDAIAEIHKVSRPTIAARLKSAGINLRTHTKISNDKRKNLHVKKTLKNGEKVWKHRWVMEQHLGRTLNLNEVVHHKNHKRYDNRIENLEVMTKSEHTKMHMKERYSSKKELILC